MSGESTEAHRTLIKICGVTRAEDAVAVAQAGCDFLGFVFAPDSPRFIEPGNAALIAARVREVSSLRVVGVFRNSPNEHVRAVAREVGLDLVQLHGDESEEDVRDLGLPAIKALSVPGPALSQIYRDAVWMMYDGIAPGSGRTFDWSLLRTDSLRRPFFLAGGLNAHNVSAAISSVQPDAVDVSSGVESAPGIKSPRKINDFVNQVRSS